MITLLLKEKRQEKGFSIRQLAQLSGVSSSHISRIEMDTANPTIHTLDLLANALDIDVKDLIIYKKVSHIRDTGHNLPE